MNDHHLVVRVTYVLGLLCGVSLVGIIVLSVLGKEIPDALKMLATGFGSALGTLLVNPRGRSAEDREYRRERADQDSA